MKKFGANLFLISILSGMLLLPIASLKLMKINRSEVLSAEDIKIEYMKQKIEDQNKEIQHLKELLETTQSEITN